MHLYAEEHLLPISALQHLLFCERQCALIHIEQIWSENRFTAEGRDMHEKVHDQGTESRRDIRTATALRLRSLRFGLTGQADVVEFHRTETNGVTVPGAAGLWQPFPVEYKRGKPKSDFCDEVQLCAQALCLEEMLETKISAGALFYGANKRRHDVEFSADLRSMTENAARRLHELFDSGTTPAAEYDRRKCDTCSLVELCQPKVKKHALSAQNWLKSQLSEIIR